MPINQNKSPYSPLLDEQVQAGIRGDFKRGWEIALELEKTHPKCNRAKFNRAWYEMMRGDLLKGLELLDAGRWEQAFGDKPLPTTKPIYRNENLKNKKLLICSEGGLGDEIINARFATEFAKKGASVTITCDPGLMSAFSRIAGVSAVVAHRSAPDIYHDFWVPGMSAARVLEKTYKTLDGKPYLSADPEKVKTWDTALEKNGFLKKDKRIGLKFYGNQKFEHEQHRRFPIQDLIDVVEPRKWVNLQLEDKKIPLQNWEDTLAVLANLDLVITSCTSIAHASAAMGRPTWVIVPILPYYIWAEGGRKSSWYDTATIFRQKEFEKWDNVFAEIKEAL